MQSINYYEDSDFVTNSIVQHKIILTANISQKLIMTEAFDYKLYCNIMETFFKINENMDLKYRWSVHKCKHNRWLESDITLCRHFVFLHGGHLETIQNGGWDPRYQVLTS